MNQKRNSIVLLVDLSMLVNLKEKNREKGFRMILLLVRWFAK